MPSTASPVAVPDAEGTRTPRFLIADVAALTGVTPSRLRSWERAGLLRPCRAAGAVRLYDVDDVALARLIARSLDNPGRRGSLRRLLARLAAGELRPEAQDYAGLEESATQPAAASEGGLPASDRSVAGVAWRSVVDAMGDLVAVCDKDGELTYANPTLRVLLRQGDGAGQSPGADGGDGVSVATLFGSGDLSLRWTARTGTPQRDIPVGLRRADGTECHTLWRVEPLCGADGAARGAVAVGRDVTAERAQARTREDRLAVAVHDLRSPVTAILGYLQLARRTIAAAASRGTVPPTGGAAAADLARAGEGPVPPRLARHVEQAETATRELLRAMQTQLDAVAASGGQLVGQLAPTEVELGGLARAAVEHVRARTTRHGLTLELPPAPLTVTGDRDRLRQLLDNLLANSVKYAPDGGPIVVRLEAASGWPAPLAPDDADPVRPWALLRVEDAGLGIPEADVPHVFDRYQRAGGAAQLVPGTGLGLYLCRAVAAAHGGHIWVERTAIAGATGTDAAGGAGGWHGTVIAVALPLAAGDAVAIGNENGAGGERVPDAEDGR